jgi:hypothetical protein
LNLSHTDTRNVIEAYMNHYLSYANMILSSNTPFYYNIVHSAPPLQERHSLSPLTALHIFSLLQDIDRLLDHNSNNRIELILTYTDTLPYDALIYHGMTSDTDHISSLLPLLLIINSDNTWLQYMQDQKHSSIKVNMDQSKPTHAGSTSEHSIGSGYYELQLLDSSLYLYIHRFSSLSMYLLSREKLSDSLTKTLTIQLDNSLRKISITTKQR